MRDTGATSARPTCRQYPAEAEAQLKLIELGWDNENSAFRQLHTSQLIPDATPEQARAFNDLMRQTTTPANAAKLLRATWAGTDNRSLGPRIKCPTLVLHARESSPFEEGRSLAALIPCARFVPLESRNHVLIESEPAWQQLAANWTAFCLRLRQCQMVRGQRSSTTSHPRGPGAGADRAGARQRHDRRAAQQSANARRVITCPPCSASSASSACKGHRSGARRRLRHPAALRAIVAIGSELSSL